MAKLLIYSKQFLSCRLLIKNTNFPRVLISSKSFCSKDNDSKNKDLKSQKGTLEKDAENTSGEKKESSEESTKVSDSSKVAAKVKITHLLNEIEVSSYSTSTSSSQLDLAKPLKRIGKKERLEQIKSNISTPEKEMNLAVKEVARNFKDPEKVETDLSEKLKSLKLSQQAEDITDESKFDSDVNEKLMSSVEEVAETISESPIPPRKELTQKLIETSKGKQGIPNRQRSMYYNEVPRYRHHRGGQMSVMAQLRLEADLAAAKKAASMERRPVSKYYKEEQAPKYRPHRSMEMKQRERQDSSYGERETGEMSVMEQIRKEAWLAAAERKEFVKKGKTKPLINKIDLFGSSPLNIFKLETEPKTESRTELWRKLQEKQVRLLSQFAPANGFEEMIMWTEQGKHWKFPINNQTEMGAEENIGFHEHVFLERHLEGFPTRGPIRHFMELVVVGLSKNPYITVQRKIDNIEWFRNYFKEKENVLKETGALA